MNAQGLKAILACGEDSSHQFKQDVTHVDSLTAELVAMANSGGGRIFIGVTDNGEISGLSANDLRCLNQLLSNAASNNVRPPLHPRTANIPTPQGVVMTVTVPNGLNSLSVEDVREGKTNRRNPTLTEHAAQMLPYRGLGSGISRALRDWPHIQLVDDKRGNEFKVILTRSAATVKEPVTPQVTPQVTALLHALQEAGELGRNEIMHALQLRDRKRVRERYIEPALTQSLITMTIPDKPRSPAQRYRLTQAGVQAIGGH